METKIKNLFKNVIKSLFLITLLSAAKCGDDVAQLTTLNATDVTGISAKTGGNITDEGNPPYTERGVCYDTSENPDFSNNKTVVSGSGIGEFSADLSGLSSGTKYYARAYALRNTDGSIEYGNQIEFTTTDEATYDFPDANFRQHLLDNFDTDKSGKLSESEVLKVTEISCSGKEIASLQGIEYFRNLTSLDCSSNQLETLDVTKSTKLTSLFCDGNQLTELDVTKSTALTGLNCDSNQLKTLDVSQCTALDYLSCSSNQLTALDVTKSTALTILYCNGNQLETLDVSKCTVLTNLGCSSNQLATLDVSKCTALNYLHCGYNASLATLKIKSGTCPMRYYHGTLITSDDDITWVD